MVKLAKLSLSTICYVTEQIELVKELMLNILPEKYRDIKINEFISSSQFGDRISILSLQVKDKHLPDIISYFSEKLSVNDKKYLYRHFTKRIDLDEKSFFIRLDKFKLLNHEFSLNDGSDVVKITIGYSAFTNSQNTEDNIRKLIAEKGIIVE